MGSISATTVGGRKQPAVRASNIITIRRMPPPSAASVPVRHARKSWICRGDVRTVTTLHGTDITLVGVKPSFWDITKFSIEKSDRVTAG